MRAGKAAMMSSSIKELEPFNNVVEKKGSQTLRPWWPEGDATMSNDVPEVMEKYDEKLQVTSRPASAARRGASAPNPRA